MPTMFLDLRMARQDPAALAGLSQQRSLRQYFQPRSDYAGDGRRRIRLYAGIDTRPGYGRRIYERSTLG